MADTGTMTHADPAHAPNTDAEDGVHGHGHGPIGEPLGPVDLAAWAYAGAGALLGVLVVLALVFAGGG